MELPRTRDVITLVKGQTFPVILSPSLLSAGWSGGQWVMWQDSPIDTFQVDFSDGTPSGFFLWGSNESADQYISYTKNQPTYNFAVLCFGSWLISTSSYERYTYASRVSGPLVPLVYTPSAKLRLSLRGLPTIEDEWTLTGDPRAPNRYYMGVVEEVPATSNNNYLSYQTLM